MAREKPSLRDRIRWIVLAVILGPAALGLGLVVVLPLAVFVITLRLLNRLVVYVLIWTAWLRRGKDVLVVLSNSPIWHDYMTSEILPLVQKRAIVLNWSERKKWSRWSFAPHVFRTFRGERNFNPLVIVFRPFRSAEVLRFWQPFQEWKHGHKQSVESLTQRLVSAL